MRRNIICFLAVITVLTISAPVFAALSGGGTESNPYLIQSRADFDEFRSNSSYLDNGKYTKLMCDLDLGDTPYSQSPIAPDSYYFLGIFDGNFRVISNLTITAPAEDYVGLFRGIGSSGEVRNLALENVNISGRSNVGSLAGGISTNPVIVSCYATGLVAGSNNVGGLAGGIRGTIILSHSSVSVTGSTNVGGLVGDNSGTINSSYAIGSVYGNTYVGGLVGYGGNISYCYATGSVTGSTNVGGLVGEGSFITNSYATGSVDGDSRVGGLVGYGDNINYCYATGLVNGSTEVGGLVGGGNYMDVCYWDMETSGQSVGVGNPGSSVYVFGKTTAEMKVISTYTVDGDHYPGWRISDMDGFDADWIITIEGQDYPQISYFAYRGPSGAVPLSGGGTSWNPYQVGSVADLVSLSQYGSTWDKHFILTVDIDMTGAFIRPIGNSVIRFTGTFDGQNHTIQNLSINLPDKDYVGLLGCLGDGGQITNLNLESVNLAGRRYVGGVVGSNYKGIVSNCHTTGTVIGGACAYVGGVVGGNIGGTVSNCSSSVTVSGPEATLGGLVGSSLAGGTISDCSATGTVTDNDPNARSSCVGGLVGSNLETAITNCSATGDVSTASASTYINIGGLAGDNLYGTSISNSFAGGNVDVNSISPTATICGGGLIGQNIAGDLNNCYAVGSVMFDCDVESYYYFGGLTGLNTEGTVNRCYSNGLIGSSGTPDADVCTAGFTGLNMDGLFSESYWDAQNSGTDDGVGGVDPDPNDITGKTTAEMMTQSTFTGWDFSEAGDWLMLREGEDYPRLAWQQMITGDVAGLYGVDAVDLEILSSCWLETVQIDSDIHTDGVVNISDFSLLAQQWMNLGCGLCSGADITGDGDVNGEDLMLMSEQWLKQVNVGCQVVDFDTSGKVNLADMAIFAGHWLEGI